MLLDQGMQRIPAQRTMLGVRWATTYLHANSAHSWVLQQQMADQQLHNRHVCRPTSRPICSAANSQGSGMDSIWTGRTRKAAEEPAAPTVTAEVWQYWQQLLEAVDKPAAKKLIKNLDMSNPLGIKHSLGQRRGAKYSKAPLYPFFLDTKKKHPTKVLLVRVGEFYETMGTDAVMLVQHAGLNPMGQGDPPRAGCPVVNLRRTISDLVEQAGLSVVVCEEAPQGYNYGARTKMKNRFIGGVVTPAQPQYLYSMMEDRSDAHDFQESPPILGIAAAVGGYKVMEVDVDMLTCQVTEGLTEDAVSARLHQGGLVPPLYLHSSIHARQDRQISESTVEAEWEQRVSQLFRSQVGLVKKYSDAEAVPGLLNLVKMELGLSTGVNFTQVTTAATDRPKPVYKSTACQLGIHKTAGVWPLLDSLLPPTPTSLLVRRWLRRLLLLPPPTEVAKSIRTACQFLSDLQTPLPEYPTLATNNIVLKLRAREANDIFFRELSSVLHAVQGTVESPALAPLAAALMPAVLEETKVKLTLKQLLDSCRLCIEQIADVVEEEEDELTRAARLTSHAEASSSDSKAIKGGGMEVLGKLFLSNEEFRGRVRLTHIAEEIEAVEKAGSIVEETLSRAFQAICEYSEQHDPSSKRPTLIFDPVNGAVWIKLIKGSQAANQAEAFNLVHPHDRNGKPIADRHCTREVEEALNDYRAACDTARAAVRGQLRLLAETLQESLLQIVAASTFAIIAAALECHVNEASRRGWTLPNQLAKGAVPEGQGMKVEDMWPYWLDGHATNTVKNSFDMSSMYLLTGPNMAGKSTVLRSVCAVALLSACGLYAPVQSAIVPYTDAFMLRNFSADSPLEGKSSFAVEMVEMRYVMDDVTENSLVLVDELGKGTEVRAGAAIAGAMLERLDAIGCRGIFATHLHQLLDMPIHTPNMVNMMMQTRAVSSSSASQEVPAALTSQLGAETDLEQHTQQLGMGGRVPTWRMVPGSSTESLALDVALQCQVPPDIVQRAAHLFKELEHEASSQQDGFAASTSVVQPDDVSAKGINQRHTPPATNAQAGPSIEDAAQLLSSVAQPLFLTLHSQQSDSLHDSQDQQVDSQQLSQHSHVLQTVNENDLQIQVQVVRGGQVPPPSTVGCSCVYIVRRGDGRFYCGQTDELKGRLNRHRSKAGKVRGGGRMEAAYLVVPSSEHGQSTAKVVEAQAIQALQAAGYPLISATDARNKLLDIADVALPFLELLACLTAGLRLHGQNSCKG
ncbi:hypothetical protein WJX79_006936 [Trebouxia sp. C0005]